MKYLPLIPLRKHLAISALGEQTPVSCQGGLGSGLSFGGEEYQGLEKIDPEMKKSGIYTDGHWGPQLKDFKYGGATIRCNPRKKIVPRNIYSPIVDVF